jgi:methyl-accepting chemotaxis protein
MHFWRKLSIQNKLILSMTSCLLVFVAISSGLRIRLIGSAVSDRVVR